MSTLWTPGRSPFHPCQSLKHLTSNHYSDAGAAGYHVSFAFNLAAAVSSLASGPLPATSVTVDWLQNTWVFEVCVSPAIIRAKCHPFSHLPPVHHSSHATSVCPSLLLQGCPGPYRPEHSKSSSPKVDQLTQSHSSLKFRKEWATQFCHLILCSISAHVNNKAGAEILVSWCLTGSLNAPWQMIQGLHLHSIIPKMVLFFSPGEEIYVSI